MAAVSRGVAGLAGPRTRRAGGWGWAWSLRVRARRTRAVPRCGVPNWC